MVFINNDVSRVPEFLVRILKFDILLATPRYLPVKPIDQRNLIS